MNQFGFELHPFLVYSQKLSLDNRICFIPPKDLFLLPCVLVHLSVVAKASSDSLNRILWLSDFQQCRRLLNINILQISTFTST